MGCCKGDVLSLIFPRVKFLWESNDFFMDGQKYESIPKLQINQCSYRVITSKSCCATNVEWLESPPAIRTSDDWVHNRAVLLKSRWDVSLLEQPPGLLAIGQAWLAHILFGPVCQIAFSLAHVQYATSSSVLISMRYVSVPAVTAATMYCCQLLKGRI